MKTNRNALPRVGILLLGIILLWRFATPSCSALTIAWTGAASSDWFNASNWSPPVVPSASDDVVINSGTVSVGADATVASLDLNGGSLSGTGTLTVTRLLNWTGGQMSGGGRTVIAPEATLNLANADEVIMAGRTLENAGKVLWTGAGNLSCSRTVLTNRGVWEVRNDRAFMYRGGDYNRFDNAGIFRKSQGPGTSSFGGGFSFNNYATVEVQSGTLLFSWAYLQTDGLTLLASASVSAPQGLEIRSGILRGVGTITGNVICGGLLDPGTPVGVLRIAGNYTQTGGGSLNLDLGGVTAGEGFDQLQISGSAALDGRMGVNLVNDFMPGFSNRFQVITCGARTGTFSRFSTDPLTRGNYLQPEYLASGVDLVSPPAIIIVSPVDGAYVRASTSLKISTKVLDSAVARVDFFANGQPLGTSSSPPFSFLWANVPEGQSSLVAEAVTAGGEANRSPLVNILAIHRSSNGQVAIVRNFPSPEINQVQTWLGEIGLASQVLEQGLNLETAKDFDLIIWDDLSYASGGITDNEVSVFLAASQLGIPLYFIGDDLAYSTVNMSGQFKTVWQELLHLNYGANTPQTAEVTLAERRHAVIAGPFGEVKALRPYIDPDAASATHSGEVILARMGVYPVLLACESPATGVRSVTQNILAVRGSDPAQERALFLNTIAWLGIESWPFLRVTGHQPSGYNLGYLTNPIDRVVLQFSRDVNPYSVRAGDLVIEGQRGRQAASALTVIDPRSYAFGFAALNEDGDYQFTLLPTATDAKGVGLDQNFNRKPGEPEDAYRFWFILDRVAPRVVQQWPAGDVAGTLSSIDVAFSEAIDLETLSPADVVIHNPSGTTIPVTSMASVGLNRFRFLFAPQTALGAYRLQVAPEISDRAGNLLDQDADNIPGEPDADVYEGVVNVVEVDLSITGITPSTNQFLVGDPVTVSWVGQNNSGTPLLGDWLDALYLSHDDQWDISDLLLATVSHTGGMASNEPYSASANFLVPAVVSEDYYLLVRTDVGNAIRENGETNNVTAGGPLPVGVRTFAPGGAVFTATLTPQAPAAYYAIWVEPGQCALLRLDGQATTGNTELFVSAGAIPTLQQHDLRASGSGMDRILAFTNPSEETRAYYVLVYGQQVDGTMPFQLSGETGPLFLTGVSPAFHGNSEPGVISVLGAGWHEYTSVEFIGAGGRVFTPDWIETRSSSVMRVNLGLTNWPAGTYTVRATYDNDTVELASAFEVVAGGAPELETRLILPSSLGFNIPIRQTIWIEYRNAGAAPMRAPLLKLYGDHFARITANPALAIPSSGYGHAPLGVGNMAQVLALGSSSTPWILQPGESGRVPIYYIGLGRRPSGYPRITMTVRTLTEDNTDPIDWAVQEHLIRPVHMDPGAWSNRFEQIKAWMGPTWGDYLRRLNEAARTWCDAAGQPTADTRRLFAWSVVESDLASVSPPGIIKSPDTREPKMDEPLASIPGRVTSPFGWRIHPTTGRAKIHEGIDIGVGEGTPLGAVLGMTGWSATWLTPNQGGGNQILLAGRLVPENPVVLTFTYMHLADSTKTLYTGGPIRVTQPGQLVAYSGNTGTSTGPHLHLEYAFGGIKTSPLAILPYAGSSPAKPEFLTDGRQFQAIDASSVSMLCYVYARMFDLWQIKVELIATNGVGITPPITFRASTVASDAQQLTFVGDKLTPYWEFQRCLLGLPAADAEDCDEVTGGSWTFRLTAVTFKNEESAAEIVTIPAPPTLSESECEDEDDGSDSGGGDDGGSGDPGDGGSPSGGPGSGAGNGNGDELIPPGDGGDSGSSDGAGTHDPNDKLGPAGYGEARFASREIPFAYQVHFENEASATAPARLITVTDVLDTDLDLSTFELTEIAFGSQVIPVPQGLREYAALIPVQVGTQSILADIQASLDDATRTLRVELKATDPATGWYPEDPLVGLLYPNDETLRGQGSISYRVWPRQGLPSGTRIENRARIVFDYNDPIDTPLAFNTVDGGVPSSRVLPVTSVSGPDFWVQWSGMDLPSESGVAGYDIYVSTDATHYTQWRHQVRTNAALFHGVPGTTYSFYSVARDNAGNAELPPSAPDAQVSLVQPPEFLAITAEPHGSVLLRFKGIADQSYAVQMSTDLKGWSTLGSARTGANGEAVFQDSNTTGSPARFYRISY